MKGMTAAHRIHRLRLCQSPQHRILAQHVRQQTPPSGWHEERGGLDELLKRRAALLPGGFDSSAPSYRRRRPTRRQ